ncbi:hypothetical protein HOL63_00830 [Candidatus Peregrinibacteria bacterium]|jgi:hypothetical protein|nr:hypothetical protein [Candidatus Peregrinibacteria bacterium]MBT7337102.1 hypothetical protein [Candidatus Peregrinibacteria bacterium]
MKTFTNTQIMAFTSAFVLLFSSPLVVLAADSSSFTLYDEVSDIADGSPLGSNSFSLDEAGETWIAYPLTGSNFQIVTAPPAQSSSVATSSSSSSTSTEETGGGGTGGHRGHETNKNPPVYTPPTKPSAPDPKPTAPPLPDLPAQVIDIPEPGVDPLPGVDFMPSEPGYDIPVYSTDDKRHERVTSRPHFFDTTDTEIAECHCPQLKPAALQIPLEQRPVVFSLMLLVAFILGYIVRLNRPGYTAVPKKVSKPKKK